jgi:hypothetical protein
MQWATAGVPLVHAPGNCTQCTRGGKEQPRDCGMMMSPFGHWPASFGRINAPPTVRSSTQMLPAPQAAHVPTSASPVVASPVTSDPASATFVAESGAVASCAEASVGPELLPASEALLEPTIPELLPDDMVTPELLPDPVMPELLPDPVIPELLLPAVPVPELPLDMATPELLPIPIEPVSAPPSSAGWSERVLPEHAAIAAHMTIGAAHFNGDDETRRFMGGPPRTVCTKGQPPVHARIDTADAPVCAKARLRDHE